MGKQRRAVQASSFLLVSALLMGVLRSLFPAGPYTSGAAHRLLAVHGGRFDRMEAYWQETYCQFDLLPAGVTGYRRDGGPGWDSDVPLSQAGWLPEALRSDMAWYFDTVCPRSLSLPADWCNAFFSTSDDGAYAVYFGPAGPAVSRELTDRALWDGAAVSETDWIGQSLVYCALSCSTPEELETARESVARRADFPIAAEHLADHWFLLTWS